MANRLCNRKKSSAPFGSNGFEGGVRSQDVLLSPKGMEKNRIVHVDVNVKGRITSVRRVSSTVSNGKPDAAPIRISVGMVSEANELWDLTLRFVDGKVILDRYYIGNEVPDYYSFPSLEDDNDNK